MPGPASGSAVAIPFRPSLKLDDLLAMSGRHHPRPRNAAASGPALNPLPVPLVFGGFSPSVFEKAGPFFTRLGFPSLRARAEAFRPPSSRRSPNPWLSGPAIP